MPEETSKDPWVVGALGRIGQKTLAIVRMMGQMGTITLGAGYWLLSTKRKGFRPYWPSTFFQMVRLGVRAVPIVSLVCLFVGMIIAISMSILLRQLGVLSWVAKIVGVAMTRELGPLMAAIIMSGYCGAAVAAEIGTMVVSEEVLALEASAMKPLRFLVLPRMLGTVVMMPCLTVLANVVGILGGYIVGTQMLDIGSRMYITLTIKSLALKDILAGEIKSVAFAVIITAVACQQGLAVTEGAEGVGKATTNAVVISIVLIIMANLFFTALFNYVLA